MKKTPFRHAREHIIYIKFFFSCVPYFLKNLYIPLAEVPFRPSEVGLRRAETAFQNFEAPLLFGYI